MMDTMKYNAFVVLFFLSVILSVMKSSSTACDVVDQAGHGCRIDNGACSCAFGCRSEFRYATMKECQNALRGASSDVCSLKPCMHNGNCIQVSQTPGYRCRCDGTGYWGNRCQRLCPTPMDNVDTFPYECIVI